MADTYTLHIQQARGGSISESDFALVGTLTGQTPGAPWSFSDSTNFLPGELLAYRARYVCSDDANTFSDWSKIVWVRAAVPFKRNSNMGFGVTTAARTQFANGLERVQGQAVKAAYGLDVQSFDLQAQPGRAQSSANRGTVARVSDETMAYTPISGNAVVDMRPEGGFMRFLQAGYYIYNVTTEALVAGVPQTYLYELRLGFTDKPNTIVKKAGDSAFVYSGVRINTLSFESVKTANTVLQATCGLMALAVARFPAITSPDLALTGLDSVSYDVKKWGPTDWAVLYNGVQSDCCESFTHSANRNLAAKDVGNYHTGASTHYADTSTVEPSGLFTWEDNDLLKQFWGITDTNAIYYGPNKEIVRGELRLRYLPSAAANGVVYLLECVYWDTSIANRTDPVGDTGKIDQNLTFTPHQDPAHQFDDHAIFIRSTEAPSALANVSPEIAPFPAQRVFPYNNVPGTTSATSTATSIISDANAFLSATNNAYNGMVMRYTTGALAGQERTITAYVASSRTFTVGTAFGSAPATGDRFIVIGGYGIA